MTKRRGTTLKTAHTTKTKTKDTKTYVKKTITKRPRKAIARRGRQTGGTVKKVLKPVVKDTVKRKIPKREYQPDNPSDERRTLAEKLLLGEELAQFSFGTTGSFQIHL